VEDDVRELELSWQRAKERMQTVAAATARALLQLGRGITDLKAWSILSRKFGNLALDPKASTALMSELARAGGFYAALTTLRWLRHSNYECGCFHITSAINACGKRGNWETGLWLLADMCTALVQPNLVTFSSAISTCEKGQKRKGMWRREWQMSLWLLSDMHHTDVHPEVYAFSATICAFQRGGQWQEALRLLSNMRTAQVQAGSITLNSAVSAYGNAAQWGSALWRLHDMRCSNLATDLITFHSVMEASEKACQWRVPLRLLIGMHSFNIRANIATYNAVVSSCERGGNTALRRPAMFHLYHLERTALKLLSIEHQVVSKPDIGTLAVARLQQRQQQQQQQSRRCVHVGRKIGIVAVAVFAICVSMAMLRG